MTSPSAVSHDEHVAESGDQNVKSRNGKETCEQMVPIRFQIEDTDVVNNNDEVSENQDNYI